MPLLGKVGRSEELLESEPHAIAPLHSLNYLPPSHSTRHLRDSALL